MSASVHVDNRIKDILILGKNPADGLNSTKITNIMDIVKNLVLIPLNQERKFV